MFSRSRRSLINASGKQSHYTYGSVAHQLHARLSFSTCRQPNGPGAEALEHRSCSLSSRNSPVFRPGTRHPQTSAEALRKTNFVYKLAAAYSGKGQNFDRKKHHYTFDPKDGSQEACEPVRVGKAHRLPSGQDSFFVSSVGQTGALAFGVADGVGGWMDSGIDSADFAHGICAYMRKASKGFPKGFEGAHNTLNPLRLLQKGYSQVCSDRAIVGGGSTACLAVAEPNGHLSVANLGDSGFIQLRLNAVHHYSNPQTHAFNTPFQLSRVPPKILAQIENFGGRSPFSDLPGDAGLSSHFLRHSDVLVFATDGVWDNLTSEQILDQVSSSMIRHGAWSVPQAQGVEVSKSLSRLTDEGVSDAMEQESMNLQTVLATKIVAKAKAASVNPRKDGPFAKVVQQAFPGERFSGGKVDDICVVVAIAVDQAAV